VKNSCSVTITSKGDALTRSTSRVDRLNGGLSSSTPRPRPVRQSNRTSALAILSGLTSPTRSTGWPSVTYTYLYLSRIRRAAPQILNLPSHFGCHKRAGRKGTHLKTDWRRLDQGGLDDIRDWHKWEKSRGGNPILVVIDTLAKVRAPTNSKSSPYQNDHDALAGLQKLAEELGIAVVLNHHDRKMDADDVFDTVSGTLGLTGAVDTILVLTKKAGIATLHVRGRDIEEEVSLKAVKAIVAAGVQVERVEIDKAGKIIIVTTAKPMESAGSARNEWDEP
jgi:hypothetical protein